MSVASVIAENRIRARSLENPRWRLAGKNEYFLPLMFGLLP
jgi:hypothetical protein